MTRRSDRNRAARRAALLDALVEVTGYRCPDCSSDVRLDEPVAGVVLLDVLHDETCPTLAERNRVVGQ